jgi:hypothetical protein
MDGEKRAEEEKGGKKGGAINNKHIPCLNLLH